MQAWPLSAPVTPAALRLFKLKSSGVPEAHRCAALRLQHAVVLDQYTILEMCLI